MKKKEYMAPEMEMVEFAEQYNLLSDSLNGGSTPEQGGKDEEVDIPGGRI